MMCFFFFFFLGKDMAQQGEDVESEVLSIEGEGSGEG